MLPLRVLSQTTHESYIQQIGISLMLTVVPASGQRLWGGVKQPASGCIHIRLGIILTHLVPRQVHRRPARVGPIHHFLVYHIPYIILHVEAQARTSRLYSCLSDIRGR